MHVCAESCRVSGVQRSEVKVHVCHVWHFLHGGTTEQLRKHFLNL